MNSSAFDNKNTRRQVAVHNFQKEVVQLLLNGNRKKVMEAAEITAATAPVGKNALSMVSITPGEIFISPGSDRPSPVRIT